MPSPPPYRNRSRSRSPGRQPSGSSSSTTARPRAPKQLDIYKSRPSSSRADPLDSLPPRGATGGSYRRGPADEDDYRSRADRRAGRGDDGGRGGGLPYGGGGARDDDRRGGYGGRDDERDRRGGSSYRDDDRRRPDDRDRDRDGRGGGGGYGRPREQDGPSTSSSSARAPPFPAPAASAPPAAAAAAPAAAAPPPRMMAGTMIEVIANDRLGRKGASDLLLPSPPARAHDLVLTDRPPRPPLLAPASPRQVLAERHGWRPQEADRGAERHQPQEGPAQEVEHHLQEPYHARRLRDPRRHVARAVLKGLVVRRCRRRSPAGARPAGPHSDGRALRDQKEGLL